MTSDTIAFSTLLFETAPQHPRTQCYQLQGSAYFSDPWGKVTNTSEMPMPELRSSCLCPMTFMDWVFCPDLYVLFLLLLLPFCHIWDRVPGRPLGQLQTNYVSGWPWTSGPPSYSPVLGLQEWPWSSDFVILELEPRAMCTLDNHFINWAITLVHIISIKLMLLQFSKVLQVNFWDS